MSVDKEYFRTFCHINEYEDAGYKNLHRMVATSWPLVLWAPSSMKIASSVCKLSPKQFVGLVDQGLIRIIGREEWITDKVKRNRYAAEKWSYAGWVPEIDDAILRIYREDEGEPEAKRRVAAVGAEGGRGWAETYAQSNPDIVDDLWGKLTGATRRIDFPVGVLEKVERAEGDRLQAVTWILRDAYNHDAALADSFTRTPFMLAPRESRFQTLMENIRTRTGIVFPTLPTSYSSNLMPEDLAELTAEIVRILRLLERDGNPKLNKFVKGEGHYLIATWMSLLIRDLHSLDPRSAREKVLGKLQAEFENNTLEERWVDILTSSPTIAGVLGLAADMPPELDAIALLGVATGVFGVGRDLARQLGLLENTHHDRSKWLFLYMFGENPSRRRRGRVQFALDRLG
ncbi:hypothetical protein [Nocardia asteroides]|uniref:hypothetical protein n=1 Tax=Nocardia asteroides TaxID=1824 RepID=UPI001E46F89B|nr:hypothetical protein [Nocardia asteroides]UGT63987.1 hypothetical protein LTT61_12055 [Nocardia asteroides]